MVIPVQMLQGSLFHNEVAHHVLLDLNSEAGVAGQVLGRGKCWGGKNKCHQGESAAGQHEGKEEERKDCCNINTVLFKTF